jgi:hypothetical protein
MAIADDIINELRKKPGMTAVKIAVNIFGRRQYYPKVYRECRRLVDAGRIERRGKGGQDDPFTYCLPGAI